MVKDQSIAVRSGLLTILDNGRPVSVLVVPKMGKRPDQTRLSNTSGYTKRVTILWVRISNMPPWVQVWPPDTIPPQTKEGPTIFSTSKNFQHFDNTHGNHQHPWSMLKLQLVFKSPVQSSFLAQFGWTATATSFLLWQDPKKLDWSAKNWSKMFFFTVQT